MAKTNYERLMSMIGNDHNPFIVYDVQTTSDRSMEGMDDRITQLALAYYKYNSGKGKYELQDNLFMLKKAEPQQIMNILKLEEPTRENAERILREEYVYERKKEIVLKLEENLKSAIKEKKRKVKFDHFVDTETERYRLSVYELKDEIGSYSIYRNDQFVAKIDRRYSARYKDEDGKPKELEPRITAEAEKALFEAVAKDYDGFWNTDVLSEDDDYKKYVSENIDRSIKHLEDRVKLKDHLAHQGISLDEWLAEGTGLSSEEIQIGINAFLTKYDNADTCYITNGKNVSKHYLKKENLVLNKADEKILDLYQIEKSAKKDIGFGNEWTLSFDQFAKAYKKDTGKEIKVFDSFTKSLCEAQMIGKLAGIEVSNRSQKQLESAVKECAFSMDEKYVMSTQRMMNSGWILLDSIPKNFDGFVFNSLEYVEFGNDRRYVDIDKMFEMNDNFEITLEGEKVPIKSWEELEAKIKSLNANISEELVKKIKSKYEEMEEMASSRKKEAEIKASSLLEESIPDVTETQTDETVTDDRADLSSYQRKIEKQIADYEQELSEIEKRKSLILQKRQYVNEKVLDDFKNFIGIKEAFRKVYQLIGEDSMEEVYYFKPVDNGSMLFQLCVADGCEVEGAAYLSCTKKGKDRFDEKAAFDLDISKDMKVEDLESQLKKCIKGENRTEVYRFFRETWKLIPEILENFTTVSSRNLCEHLAMMKESVPDNALLDEFDLEQE
ncbi:MAG: hypothetical protein HUJ53_05315 [Holdemanella sp.]|nr:hypothetical protein [Holdemanella sp.]